MEVRLTSLGRVIERCWKCAEQETSNAVARKYHAPNEEQLTFLFASELRAVVAEASSTGEVERAFRADLRSISGLDDDAARRASSKLIARVNFHGRQHEGKKSASDLGIVIRRPLVRLTPYGARLELRRDQAIGLLAQAKLRRLAAPKKSGRLTRKQARLFPERSAYYSLLLYRLDGQNTDELKPFRWQLCKEHTVEQVKSWLRSDAFPEEMSSLQIIRKLFDGTIGTKDAAIIQTIIDAPATSEARFIDIQIFWPEGAPPPPRFLELRRHAQELQVVQPRR